jgi:hypothetical protein
MDVTALFNQKTDQMKIPPAKNIKVAQLSIKNSSHLIKGEA